MSIKINKQLLDELKEKINGELKTDSLHKVIYATDASVYRVLPAGVVYPANTHDVREVVLWAGKHCIPLVPRTAGTSLAGQCVGEGLIVDLSRHMCKILEVNRSEKTVVVQPGVIRDELNLHLAPFGLYYGPNTSTANRAMIGGMVGNNSCGSTSIVSGTTRDHVYQLETVLSNGQIVNFSPVTTLIARNKSNQQDLEGKIYKQLLTSLSKKEVVSEIRNNYPKRSIHRRNNGYAIDTLLTMQPFSENGPELNLCSLLCGAEGTLGISTEITLTLEALPLPEIALVCGHFKDVQESLLAAQIAMTHRPEACELMDKVILDCTLENREQRKNRFFVSGEPGSILMVEFRDKKPEDALLKANNYISTLKAKGIGYAYPVLDKSQSGNAWELRKAGLGLLANIPGKRKAVACIEDTAVDIADLPQYIAEFNQIMEQHGQQAVYYAHAGAGELHLRPVLDLKDHGDVKDFRSISHQSAKLVKKYQGSLAGEHGVGRVRAEFLQEFIGDKNYNLLLEIKETWDPLHIFNPGKIVHAPPMDEALRYTINQPEPKLNTLFRYPHGEGILGMAEKCNGSGDCRKLPSAGGTMCPSYQATHDEKDTTRARANVLREYLTRHHHHTKNPFGHPQIKEVLDLCLSCKGCTSECPSNVDMSMLKAEFQYQYYQSHRRPLSHWFVIHNHLLGKFGSWWPGLTNQVLTSPWSRRLLFRVLGFHHKRLLPLISSKSLSRKYQDFKNQISPKTRPQKVYLFCDEFTQWYDADIGLKAVQLLTGLDYEVVLTPPLNSARAHFSKGYLSKAKRIAEQNVSYLDRIISSENPLLGIEPSAILSFRDEYPKLVDQELELKAAKLAANTFLIEEFLAQEISDNKISPEGFSEQPYHLYLHGHCHQKSITDLSASITCLSLPKKAHVEVIPSGCCGMAGAFGYERANYEVSMKVGELVLFPAVRKATKNSYIVASGTSCRHQIREGTGKTAIHPVEFLWLAMNK